MKHKFILSSESTCDLPYGYVTERDIPVLFYTYTIDDEVFEDDMGRAPKALPAFYAKLDGGKMANTSQINTFRYEEFFRELLAQGDVLHIAMGSGMSASASNAIEAGKNVAAEFPDRKIIVIDTLSACGGTGLILDDAADMRDAGASIDEVAQWVNERLLKMYHRFYATNLMHLRRGGRVSGPTAAIGTVLGICPIMRLDEKGKIFAHSKVRGKKNAIKAIAQSAVDNAAGGQNYEGKLFVNTAGCPEDGETMVALLKEMLPKADISLHNIGSVIGAHTGRGTVAIFFWGENDRPAREE